MRAGLLLQIMEGEGWHAVAGKQRRKRTATRRRAANAHLHLETAKAEKDEITTITVLQEHAESLPGAGVSPEGKALGTDGMSLMAPNTLLTVIGNELLVNRPKEETCC